jgi:hypothetical protein
MRIEGYDGITSYTYNKITEGERYSKGERARIRHISEIAIENGTYDTLSTRYFKSEGEAMAFFEGIRYAMEQAEIFKRNIDAYREIIKVVNESETEADAILNLHCLTMNMEFDKPNLLLKAIVKLTNKTFDKSQIEIIAKAIGAGTRH